MASGGDTITSHNGSVWSSVSVVGCEQKNFIGAEADSLRPLVSGSRTLPARACLGDLQLGDFRGPLNCPKGSVHPSCRPVFLSSFEASDPASSLVPSLQGSHF